MSSTLMSTYRRLPVAFSRGRGAILFDTDDQPYLDALGGIAVCGLGHAHPTVQQAIADQAGKLLHTSNLYGIDTQQQLADRLVALSGMDSVFFSNSGAEANETAIKLARLYGHNRGIDNPAVIVMENSFHGRTMATLSATGNRKAQAGFEPLVQGFMRVPYNDIGAIEYIAANRPDTVAILVEPIQGEAGINVPADNYLNELRTVCDEQEWLLMLDEIQTGIGRTGKWFAYQHNDIVPDVLTLAKALGNGVPISACIARGAAAQTLTPGTHGSTFGGNPLACSAALAVLDTVSADDLPNHAGTLGQHMLDGFKRYLAGVEGVIDIRGKGLMLGIELSMNCTELVGRALDKKLLINVTGGNRVRLLPPLIIDRQMADTIVDTVSELIRAFLSENRDGT